MIQENIKTLFVFCLLIAMATVLVWALVDLYTGTSDTLQAYDYLVLGSSVSLVGVVLGVAIIIFSIKMDTDYESMYASLYSLSVVAVLTSGVFALLAYLKIRGSSDESSNGTPKILTMVAFILAGSIIAMELLGKGNDLFLEFCKYRCGEVCDTKEMYVKLKEIFESGELPSEDQFLNDL